MDCLLATCAVQPGASCMSPGVCRRGWDGGMVEAVGCVGGGRAVKKWGVREADRVQLAACAWTKLAEAGAGAGAGGEDGVRKNAECREK